MNPGARARPGPRRGLRGHLPGVAAAVGAERQRSLEAEQTKEGQEGGGEPAGRHDEGPGVGPGPGAGPGHATRDPARVAATAHTKPARSGAEAGAGEERSGGRGGEKAAGRGGRTAPGGLGWGCPPLGLGVSSPGSGSPLPRAGGAAAAGASPQPPREAEGGRWVCGGEFGRRAKG